MRNKVFFLLILSFCFLFHLSYAQEPQVRDDKKSGLDSVNVENIFSEALINKMSEEKLERLLMEYIEREESVMEIKMDTQEEMLEKELDYHKDSGIPRFLTPTVALWGYIFVSLTILAVIAVPLYFHYKKHMQLLETIKEIAARGQNIPAELWGPLKQKREKRSALTIGIILSAIGLGTILFLMFITDPDEGVEFLRWKELSYKNIYHR